MARLTDNNFTKKNTLDENNDYLLVDNATQGSAAVTVKTFMDKHKGEPHLTISTTATSGVDKDLRDALAEKGWSDQIVGGEIDIKAMFAEIAASLVDDSNPLIELDTTAEEGTTDGDLYAAITALGWESEVIDALSNVIAKKALTKLMQDAESLFRGADDVNAINYGNPASVTPTRDGWLVVRADTDNDVTIAPIIRLKTGGLIVAEQTGITYAGSPAYLSCHVKKGKTYTVETYRCSRVAVYLY